jgi:hypothetical protein
MRGVYWRVWRRTLDGCDDQELGRENGINVSMQSTLSRITRRLVKVDIQLVKRLSCIAAAAATNVGRHHKLSPTVSVFG